MNIEDKSKQSNKIFEYQILKNQMQESILFFNEDGSVLEWNKVTENELGYEEFEMKQINIAQIFRKTFFIEDNKVKLYDDFSFENERTKPYETVAYRKNHTCFHVSIHIFLPQQEDIYGVCIATSLDSIQDVKRELKKVKEELQQAEKIKREFVANITHELRTPLNGMIGLTKNLLESELNRNQLENVHIIDTCCSNMVKIINDLLDFSKMDAGKMTFEEKEFNFRDFFEQTMDFNKNLVNQKGLRLIANVAEDIPDRVIGDELRIAQILNNLIGNAIKFTSIGHIVVEVIKTLENEDVVELFFMIIDSGIGIAEGEKDKLFKSFSQVDSTITRRFGGTGLGLAICKELVEQMHGRINVESEKGNGSTFSFSIQLKLTAQKDTQNVHRFFEESNKRKEEEYINLKKNSNVHDFELKYGTIENLEKIMKIMEKLILCIELGTWNKAEIFIGMVKKMIADEDILLKRQAFRLELSVRKEVYNQSIELYNELLVMIENVKDSSQNN